MWGSAMPTATVAGGSYVDSQAVFPIMHFTNQLDSTGNPDGKGVLRIWDTTVNLTGGWVYLSGTENLIQYGGWNSIDLRLIPEQSKGEYYFNGRWEERRVGKKLFCTCGTRLAPVTYTKKN